MTTELQGRWEKEFDEKALMSFAKGGFLTTDYGELKWALDPAVIKSFMRSLLTDEKKAWGEGLAKEVEGWKQEYDYDEDNPAHQDIEQQALEIYDTHGEAEYEGRKQGLSLAASLIRRSSHL